MFVLPNKPRLHWFICFFCFQMIAGIWAAIHQMQRLEYSLFQHQSPDEGILRYDNVRPSWKYRFIYQQWPGNLEMMKIFFPKRIPCFGRNRQIADLNFWGVSNLRELRQLPNKESLKGRYDENYSRKLVQAYAC